MTLDQPSLAVGAAASFLVSYLLFRVLWALQKRRLRQQARHHSRATIHGQVAEQLAPLFAAFPYASGDARFLGAPIDYVVFDGLTDDDDIEVVLVEIKTGRAKLSERERRVRDAVRDGRVRFETIRL